MKLKTMLLLVLAVLLFAACGKEPQTIDLLTAVDQEKSDVVQELLESGIDPNKDPIAVGMPFEWAYPLYPPAIRSNKEIVQILLDNGATIDLEAKNKDEATPLHWAAFFGRKDIVSLLIESGAPINALDANHSTPLDSAAFAWSVSQGDYEGKARLGEILTIIKDNGGVSAGDL